MQRGEFPTGLTAVGCRRLSSAAFVALFLWALSSDQGKAEWRLGPYSAPPDFLLLMLWCWADARRDQIRAVKVWARRQVTAPHPIGFLRLLSGRRTV